jgi:hypothetical protein
MKALLRADLGSIEEARKHLAEAEKLLRSGAAAVTPALRADVKRLSRFLVYAQELCAEALNETAGSPADKNRWWG